MTLPGAPAVEVDAGNRWIFRAGSLSAFLLVAGYLATFPLYALVGGPPPSGIEAHLAHYGGHVAGWWGILGLMVSTDLLFAVVWLALYQALERVHRHLMLLALVCEGLFVTLDLAVTWPSHAALFVLGGNYVGATEAQRTTIVAAAGFPSAVLESPVAAIYAVLFPALGIFLAGLVMLKGGFSKSTAIVAILVGATAVVAVAGPYLSKALDLAHVVNALLVTVWFLLVAIRLHQLARR